MTMTKKDYTVVARAIREQRARYKEQYKLASKAMDDFAETMAAHFSLLNDNFKKDMFLKESSEYGEGNE
jgi:hypothetical protein